MSNIPDGCEKRRIDHGGANTEECGSKSPGQKPCCHGQRQNGRSLKHHSPPDEKLPSPPVTERSSRKLNESPHSRVKRAKDAHFSETQTAGCEEKWQKSPRHSVIQVVNHPRLTDRK